MALPAPPALPPAATHRAHGLEWLPAGADPQPLPRRPATCSHAHEGRRPLVVILPWMWAARASVARHAALYHSLGCDVAVFYSWPALSVWLPPLARRNAATLLAALSTHLREQGPRDILLVCFSGAAKGVLCPLLERLVPGAAAAAAAALSGTAHIATGEATPSAPAAAAPPAPPSHLRFLLSFLPGLRPRPSEEAAASAPWRKPQPPPPTRRRQPDPAAELLLQQLRGVLFDSGPVDFDSSVGVRLFATARHPGVRSLQAAVGAAAAGTLDFCLYEAFESQRRAMWVSLRHGLAAAGLPVAFLYSWSGDALADPQPIHWLAVALREDAAAETGVGTCRAAASAAGAECGSAGAGARRRGIGSGGVGEGGGAGGGSGGIDASGAAGPHAREHWPTLSSGSSSSDSSGSRSSSSSSSSSSNDSDGGEAPAPGSTGRQERSPPDRTDGSGCGGCSSGAAPAAPAAAGVRSASVRVQVWEQGWDCSPHVAHLRAHPEQYRRVVEAFLNNCLGAGSRAGVVAAAVPAAPALPGGGEGVGRA